MLSSLYLNLPESKQFNGKNFQAFRVILETTIAGKGLQGYLDRTIPRLADSFTAQNTVIPIYTTPSGPASVSTAGQATTPTSSTQAATIPTTLSVHSDELSTQWNLMKRMVTT